MSRRQQQQAARGLLNRRIVAVSTARVAGSPHVIATLSLDDGTRVEIDHVIERSDPDFVFPKGGGLLGATARGIALAHHRAEKAKKTG